MIFVAYTWPYRIQNYFAAVFKFNSVNASLKDLFGWMPCHPLDILSSFIPSLLKLTFANFHPLACRSLLWLFMVLLSLQLQKCLLVTCITQTGDYLFLFSFPHFIFSINLGLLHGLWMTIWLFGNNHSEWPYFTDYCTLKLSGTLYGWRHGWY